MASWTSEIMGVLQEGYGDSSQTVLDQRVAQAIEKRLRELGWAAPDEVRALVACAGGEIVLDERFMLDPPAQMFITDDLATMRRKVFVR